MRKRAIGVGLILVFAAIAAAAIILVPKLLNRYQDEGVLHIPGLAEPVTVVRDEKGMAAIRAKSLDDAMVTLGFVTAQDRLFQMELTKLFACGRICELVGEKGKILDARMRTIGFLRNGAAHARMLDEETRRYFQKYLDGVNAYISKGGKNHPLEFRLAGIRPEPWTVAESMAVLYYMSWDTSANLETEIVAGMLVDRLGIEKARKFFPLNINPDDEAFDDVPEETSEAKRSGPLSLTSDGRLMSFFKEQRLEIGSNNWAVSPARGKRGGAIVANDPHLDARILPGPWYPACLITPDLRVVGVHIPGLPAMPIMRNQDIAVGITNAYGDSQDLYVETLDPENPGNYLEGDRSIPFRIVEEVLRIRDEKAEGGFRKETMRVRFTRRGPVVSGVLPGLAKERVITLRWSPLETMGPRLGLIGLMRAKTVWDVRDTLADVNLIMLNFVFADRQGNVGWHASGRLPMRSAGDGTVPFEVVDGEDNWRHWIPHEEMPHLYNPPRGWVGTCNHATTTRDYPHYYSSHQSPSYRYRRLKELLDPPGLLTAEDHWAFQRDTRNVMAERLAPILAEALSANEATRAMGELLAGWDFCDDPDQAAPLVFHSIYERTAFLTFKDLLGEKDARLMLSVWYFWQERFQRMMESGKLEDLDSLIVRAALDVQGRLAPELGRDPGKWLWGDVHRVEFVSPIRREGPGKGILGGGSHAAPGSVVTLHRGYYDFNDPYQVTVMASLRMVADLQDSEKVAAVLPGGVAGRIFHPHTKDQIRPFMNGDMVFWWFSDEAIRANASKTLELLPAEEGS